MKENALKSICFLDWQLTRYAPPVLDLLYQIFGGTDAQFRKNHYQKLLSTYYSSLSETIRKLGSDPDKLYTFENLQEQMKIFGEFSLYSGPLIIQTLVASENDIRNLDEYAEQIENGEQADLLEKFDDEKQQKYSQLINELINDLVNYEYVSINN